MVYWQKVTLVVLRVLMGWVFFYAGITKVINPAWSAAGYLLGAKTFPQFYHFFASPAVLPLTNALNAWGLTLVGASLILGLAVRVSGSFGILLMLLYYFPILNFPYPDANSFIVDQHLVYAAVCAVLVASRAGRPWGLDGELARPSQIRMRFWDLIG